MYGLFCSRYVQEQESDSLRESLDHCIKLLHKLCELIGQSVGVAWNYRVCAVWVWPGTTEYVLCGCGLGLQSMCCVGVAWNYRVCAVWVWPGTTEYVLCGRGLELQSMCCVGVAWDCSVCTVMVWCILPIHVYILFQPVEAASVAQLVEKSH